jgi:hypothetical protein
VEAAKVERANGGMLRKLAVLSAAGIVALAYATPGRADDQSPPPPLMLGTSAAIVPDEPDAVVDISEPVSVTEPVPAKAVAVDGWELAAKPRHSQAHAHARVRTAPVRATAAPVISRSVRTVRPIRPHHAAKSTPRGARATRSEWYQVVPRQYRPARASDSRSVLAAPVLSARDAPLRYAEPRPDHARTPQTICQLRARKCVQLCGSDVSYTVSQNERWIRVCIYASYSTRGLDKVHLLLMKRLWSMAAAAELNGSAAQYQCFSPQYQSGNCSETRSVVAPAPHRRVEADTKPVADPAPRHESRVLAAVVTREQRPAKAAVVRVRSAARRPEPSPGVPEAAAGRRDAAASSDGWLLRALVALVGVALLSVLLTAVFEVPAIGTMRTRLASKGLSSSRIDLRNAGAPAQRRGGISYRD